MESSSSSGSWGVVRATGASTRHLQRIVFLQAVIVGSLGLIQALVAGLVLAIFPVKTVLPKMLGWCSNSTLHTFRVPAGVVFGPSPEVPATRRP